MTIKNELVINRTGKYYVVHDDEYTHSTDSSSSSVFLDLPDFSTLELGEYIRLHRVIKNLSLSELAKQIDIDYKHLDKIEKSLIKRPQPKTLEKLISIFGQRFSQGVEVIISRKRAINETNI